MLGETATTTYHACTSDHRARKSAEQREERLSRRRSLNNNVLGTDMLLKPSRKERSACPGVAAFNDNVKGTETEAQKEGRLVH